MSGIRSIRLRSLPMIGAVRSLDRLQCQRHGQQFFNLFFTQKQWHRCLQFSISESNDQHDLSNFTVCSLQRRF